MKLHIHNDNPIKGWTDLDVSNRFKPEKLPFKDQEFDYIYITEIFEFLDKDQRMDFLSELKRIIKHGGLIRMSVPDFFKLSKIYPNKMNLYALEPYLYRKAVINNKIVKNEFWYDFIYLQKVLIMSGFYSVKRYDNLNTEHKDFKDISFDKIGFDEISLNVEFYG